MRSEFGQLTAHPCSFSYSLKASYIFKLEELCPLSRDLAHRPWKCTCNCACRDLSSASHNKNWVIYLSSAIAMVKQQPPQVPPTENSQASGQLRVLLIVGCPSRITYNGNVGIHLFFSATLSQFLKYISTSTQHFPQSLRAWVFSLYMFSPTSS